MMSEKITKEHLKRGAYVYIRQSTQQQVRNNRESQRLQYALKDRATGMGFSSVIVIDDDLGISGTGSHERPGFCRLLAAVCNGEVGGVFALDASRLARNNRDWHHLIDLCTLTRTVVVDAEGVYDPGVLNDRLLLGLKGTMSEFELGILRQRAQEAYRKKVFRGEVLTRVPIGYVRQGDIGIEVTPNREIQEALRGLFTRFESSSSLRQAHLWYHQEKILFPVIRRCDGAETLEWQLPNYRQLLSIVRNPSYAGAFVWGRTCSRDQIVDGRSRKSGGHRVSMDQWQVLLKDHHEAYITWDQYMENINTLESNRTKSHQVTNGAARKGSALLAGLLRCSRCGCKLHVGYRGKGHRAPRYYCATGNRETGKPSCLSFGGVKVEQAVVDVVLETCQPMGVEASLQALDGCREEQGQKRKSLELALERARFETDRARRQFDAVDPANRLVASELEARWNASLLRVAEAEDTLLMEQEVETPLDTNQRACLLSLGEDLSALWEQPSTSPELKKRIIRAIVNEIMVDVNHGSGYLEMQIHWAGGSHTPLRVRKNKSGRNRNATCSNIIDLVKELSMGWGDAYIASMLNRMGLQTGKGNSWTETRVRNLRLQNKIPVHSKSTKRPWKTMSEASVYLGVSNCVIRTMIRNKILPARQLAKGAPWMIKHEDLNQSRVENYIKQARRGNPAPCEDNNQMLSL